MHIAVVVLNRIIMLLIIMLLIIFYQINSNTPKTAFSTVLYSISINLITFNKHKVLSLISIKVCLHGTCFALFHDVYALFASFA